MPDSLRVRLYNVRFGDAILVMVPDLDDQGAPLTRHILFDVGNILSGAGGSNAVYEPIFRDILATLNGRPLDLYVMTHEHLDHVEGPRYAAASLGLPVSADTVWMTASAEGEAYYQQHPEARRKKKALLAALDAMRPLVAASGSERMSNMLRNNDPSDHMTATGIRAGTAACVDHIRNAMNGQVHFVHREADVSDKHPFRRAQLRILGPEKDTSTYYGRPRPFQATGLGEAASSAPSAVVPTPPRGVDAGAFYDLVRARETGFPETLLAIDKAANNTSIVLELKWGDHTLLFAGDAELASWRTMLRLGLLGPVDFLKVGHHGSHNGTPLADIDTLFPPTGDPANRHVAVSTCVGSYNGVPHETTMQALQTRARVHDTRTVGDGQYIEVEFAP